MPNKKTVKKEKKKALPAAKKKVAAKPVKKAAPKKIVAKAAPVAKKAVAKKLEKKPEKVVLKSKAPAAVAGKKTAVAAPAKKGAVPAPKAAAKAVAPVAKPTPEPKLKAKKEKAAPKEEAPVEETLEAKGLDEEEEVEEVVLTDAEGRRYCRVKDCDQLASVDGYCRYHYLLYWKRIQVRKKILSEGKLERYVEELTARYPDKFLDMLRKDLRSEKEFLAAIQELEIDESAMDNDNEDETQTYIDEVRGMGGDVASTREEEDF